MKTLTWRCVLVAAVLAMVVGAAGPARASTDLSLTAPPSASISIGSSVIDVPFSPVGAGYESNGGQTFVYSDANGTVTLNALADPDPSLSYDFSITNLSSSVQTFTINFTLPLSPPLAGPSLWEAFFSGTLSGPEDGSAATVAPAAGFTTIEQAGFNGTFVPALALGTASLTGSGNTTYPSSSASFVETADVNAVNVHLAFTLTPGATFEAKGFVATVPEPATLAPALSGVVLVGLVLAWRRRRGTA